MPSESLLSRFAGLRRAGDGWLARCPAHDDARASLSIGTGADGRVLLHCHAGCATETVLAATGLTMADLYERRSGASQIVATYNYLDEAGTLLYQVCRLSPKDFRQRRPDGAGGWTWTLGKVRRVLFGLPELRGQKVTYVAEGEKDVLALRAIGLVVTTNAGGAGKWRDDYTEQLKAAGVESVVILPDNDEAGRAHAVAVARSCHAAGLGIKVVTLPDLQAKGDVSDWLDAGHTRGDLIALVKTAPLYEPSTASEMIPPSADAPTFRTVHLTSASSIKVRPVRWLWESRVALGTLGLLGGREGVGKTICAYTLAASITRGKLPGVYTGTPRSVIVAAAKDSWEHTIVPRLMAAGADLDRVYRVDVMTAEGTDTTLSLPRDLAALERVVREVQAALILLDPLLSRLDTALDTHKDAEVRVALEPIVTLAGATETCVLGLIHVNKSASSDVLTLLMGSRAFAAVARAVLFVMINPDDESVRLLGQAKNNLGRCDLPTLTFRIVSACVAETDEGPVWTGKLEWLGETNCSINEAVHAAAAAAATSGDRTATSEAADWLHDYLTSEGGTRDSAIVQQEGRNAGHSKNALYRARKRLRIVSKARGFPRKAYWSLPSPEGPSSGESAKEGIIGTTEGKLSQSSQSLQAPARAREEGSTEDDRWTL